MYKKTVWDKQSNFKCKSKVLAVVEKACGYFREVYQKADIFPSTSRTYILTSSAIPVHAEKYSQRNIYNVDLILNIWFYTLKYL